MQSLSPALLPAHQLLSSLSVPRASVSVTPSCEALLPPRCRPPRTSHRHCRQKQADKPIRLRYRHAHHCPSRGQGELQPGPSDHRDHQSMLPFLMISEILTPERLLATAMLAYIPDRTSPEQLPRGSIPTPRELASPHREHGLAMASTVIR